MVQAARKGNITDQNTQQQLWVQLQGLEGRGSLGAAGTDNVSLPSHI